MGPGWLSILPPELTCRLAAGDRSRVALSSTCRDGRARWRQDELRRLLRRHPSLEQAAQSVPLHQLRAFLQGLTDTGGGMLRVADDGELWFTPPFMWQVPGSEVRLVVQPAPDGPPVRVLSAQHNDDIGLLVLCGGQVMMCPLDLPAAGGVVPNGRVWDLGGERAVQAHLLRDDMAYVLTDAGRLWALLWAVAEPGGAPMEVPPGVEPAEVREATAAGRAVPVRVLSDGEPAPRFTLFHSNHTWRCRCARPTRRAGSTRAARRLTAR